jgi:KDO2-lipid IV(A) lauroyltransferase
MPPDPSAIGQSADDRQPAALNPMLEAGARIFKYALYALWQVLPLDFASGFGAVVVRIIALRYRRTTAATRNALRRVNPAYTESDLDRILFNMWQNMGRVWAEALIPHRLARRRLKIIGQQHLDQAKSLGRPIIAPFLHTGNWEIVAPVLAWQQLNPHSIAEPMRRKFFDELLNRVRADCGLVPVTPDLAGTRQIYRYLERGDTMCIAIDEYKNRVVLGPTFGRQTATPTNIDLVIRLAQKFHAVVIPGYVRRLHGASFELHISPPLPPEHLQGDEGKARLKQHLEAWSESAIRAHIDQWYMLHRLRFP